MQHWHDWLKTVEEPDIWTVQHMISAPATDRGKARIPILKWKTGEQETTVSTNKEKSAMLAQGFFLPKP